ncbi:zinc finger Ran-binding domain-containing protein, partial [Striga asiatica]
MGSQEKDKTTPHHLSSLVVRTSTDYRTDELHRAPAPPYSRSRPYRRTHSRSISPVRHNRRFSNPSDRRGPPFSRGPVNKREPRGRYRDYSPSPPYERHVKDDFGRFGSASAREPQPLRSQGPSHKISNRNNPNVRPREGDWICADPTCENLNFARRDSCNSCGRPRFTAYSSPPGRGPFDHSTSRVRGWGPPSRNEVSRYNGSPPMARDWEQRGGKERREWSPWESEASRVDHCKERREWSPWESDTSRVVKARSRSPVRGWPRTKEYRQSDVYPSEERVVVRGRGSGRDVKDDDDSRFVSQ